MQDPASPSLAEDTPAPYERRRPEETTLYQVIQDHIETFLAQVEQETGAGLPQFVKDEFDAFLECGILAHGFLRLRCGDCAHEKLVAFSCKRRGFCPACGARRMMVKIRLQPRGSMMNKVLALLLLCFGMVLFVATPMWADFDSGERAYISEDFETAFQEWSPLAAQGDAEAQNMLGYMYRWGQGVGQDFAKAQEWYLRSANQGHARAQNNLGMIYLQGLGVPKNHQQAFYWFLRAAEQDNAAGQNHLGLLYFKGEGVTQDYIQSYKWALLAANQGMDAAMMALPMLEEVMTPAQLEEAKQLAKKWKPKGQEEVL